MFKIREIFPYSEIRPVQESMIRTINVALSNKKHVALEGPTGMGKTIATLCGVLLSTASDKRIVYCCRTHKQMDRVIEELKGLSKKIPISGLSLRGRREMCTNPLIRKFTESATEAALACGMMRKLKKCEQYESMTRNSARATMLQDLLIRQPLTAGELIELCREENFCPYEIARGALQHVKVIATSYIYILDPWIRPLFLRSMNADLSDIVMVFDEAHNLQDIATELASDSLSTSSLSAAAREARECEDNFILEFISVFQELVDKLANEKLGDSQDEETFEGEELLRRLAASTKPFGIKLGELFKMLEEVGEKHIFERLRQGKAPRSYLHKVGLFLNAWQATSGSSQYLHVISRSTEKRETSATKLEIQALDPRLITLPVIGCVHATISMSGTLAPVEAYRDVIGLPKDTVIRQYSSPFPEENIIALAVKGVTTKETYRKQEMYRKISELVAEIAGAVPANVGVFAASHEVLEGLLDAGIENLLPKPLFHESREMSSSENDRLIRDFKSYAKRGGAVLLAVQGGRSSEGADYPGDEMNASVVVGIPYAKPTKRNEAVIRYYEAQFPGRGRSYAYYMPAHRRMSQAAGRAHRLVTDKAAIIFLDWRVTTPFVRRSLPSWIRERLEVLPDRRGVIAERLLSFFNKANF